MQKAKTKKKAAKTAPEEKAKAKKVEEPIKISENESYPANIQETHDEFGNYSYELKIPKERVAVLIGKKGETKKQIEEETGSKLKIDSGEGDVIISGNDSIKLFSVREIIQAIGRGFNPEIAKQLLKQDYSFEVINLIDYAGKSKSDMIRFKGRIIGAGGKARRIIEELTECHISVYGKTVAIIGQLEDVANAKRAIENLLAGSPHSSVYKFLEKQRKMSRIGLP